MTYSVHFRKKVLSVREKEGLSFTSISKKFNIGRNTIFIWTKKLHPQKHRDKKAIKIDPDKLRIETGEFYFIIISQIVLSILAACYICPEPVLQAEFYPTNIRNTALSLSYNTATSIFGGTTPLILEYLVQKTGTITSSIYYVIACAISILIALCFYKDRSRG